MNQTRVFIGCVFVTAMSVDIAAHASNDTVGPNGINSAGLTLTNGNTLTGSGIAIGQVEDRRPGKIGVDPANMLHPSVNPTAVFRQDGAANLADARNHSEQVAGVMISSDGNATGVATGASLYSSADIDPGAFELDPGSAISLQHVANQNGGDVRVINMSFGNPFLGSEILDGNSLLTLFVDWSAFTHDKLYIKAGNQNVASTVSDNFNGLTVASSRKNGSKYRQVDSGNFFLGDAEGPRTSIDLIAPGFDVRSTILNNMLTPVVPQIPNDPVDDGTSFAAPHVTGTVALLQKYADFQINAGATNWGGTVASVPTPRRHEVMKAVLMNSADNIDDIGDGKYLGMSRTVLRQNGSSTWLNSPAFTDPAFRSILKWARAN